MHDDAEGRGGGLGGGLGGGVGGAWTRRRSEWTEREVVPALAAEQKHLEEFCARR